MAWVSKNQVRTRRTRICLSTPVLTLGCRQQTLLSTMWMEQFHQQLPPDIFLRAALFFHCCPTIRGLQPYFSCGRPLRMPIHECERAKFPHRYLDWRLHSKDSVVRRQSCYTCNL